MIKQHIKYLLIILLPCMLTACINVDDFIKHNKQPDPEPPAPNTPTPPGSEQPDPNNPPKDNTGSVDVIPGDKNKNPNNTQAKLEIDYIYPNTIQTNTETFIRLRGKAFTKNTELTLGNTKITDLTFINDNLLRFKLPPSSKQHCLSVTLHDNDKTAQKSDAICYIDPITITEIPTPNIYAHTLTPIELHGLNFHEPLSIAIANIPPKEIKILSPQKISILTENLPPGTHNLRISSKSGTFLLKNAIKVKPQPIVSTVTPSHIPQNTQTTIKINGNHFSKNTTTILDSHLLTPITSTATLITASTPQLSQGQKILLLNQDNIQILPTPIKVYMPSTTPQIFSITPQHTTTDQNTLITITGENLPPNPTIKLDTHNITPKSATPNEITFITPKISNEQSLPIVINPNNNPLQAPQKLNFEKPLELNNISAHLTSAQNPQKITLKATKLPENTKIFFDDKPANFTNINKNEFILTPPKLPPSTVIITAKYKNQSYTLPQTFTYLDKPEIFAFSPTSTPIIGGEKIHIYGKNFHPSCTVNIGNIPIKNIENIEYNLIEFYTPEHKIDSMPLTINCPNGNFTTTSKLSFVDNTSIMTSASGTSINGAIFISVRQAQTGKPIENAEVFIGANSNTKYKEKTNKFGQAAIYAPELTGIQSIYACASGHSCATIQLVNASNITLFLEPTPPDINPNTKPEPPPPPPPPSKWDINPIIIDVPPDTKPTLIKGKITGFGKVDLETGPNTVRAALVIQSQPIPIALPPKTNDKNFIVGETGQYSITPRLGDFALVVVCGIQNTQTLHFEPRFMGIKRFLFITTGQTLNIDLECNIPLNQTIEIKLLDAPFKSGPNMSMASAFLHVGNEGYVGGFMNATSHNEKLTITKVPALRGELQDMDFTITAGAYTNGSSPSSTADISSYIPTKETLQMGPLVGIPSFNSPNNENPLQTGQLSWQIENPQNIDFYSANIRLSTDKGTKPLWQFYLPGSATSVEFPTQNLDLQNYNYANLYISISAFKSLYKGYDYNLFSSMDLKWNYTQSSSYAFEIITLKTPMNK